MSVTVSRVILFLLLAGLGTGLAFFLRSRSAPTSLGTAVVEASAEAHGFSMLDSSCD